MPIGKGRYDDECTRVREATNAMACVLLVFGESPETSGFSVQVRSDLTLDLPGMLRQLANDIDHDLGAARREHGTHLSH